MLNKNGIPDKKKLEQIGISRATYYWRKQWLKCPVFKSHNPQNVRKSKFGAEIYSLISRIRAENKTYGKAKLYVILRRNFCFEISESSVERIMKKLRFPRSRSALRCRKKRNFNKYAQPFKLKKYNEMEIWENVQINHMTVTKDGVVMKHVVAIEMFSEHVLANVYSKANSTNAAKFLRELIENIPYKVRSIQADRGSEFTQDFEDACRELAIPRVLPSAKPTYNGKVERSNRREEFYDNLLKGTITGTRRKLSKFVRKCNSYRPRVSLHELPPLEYISKLSVVKDEGLSKLTLKERAGKNSLIRNQNSGIANCFKTGQIYRRAKVRLTNPTYVAIYCSI